MTSPFFIVKNHPSPSAKSSGSISLCFWCLWGTQKLEGDHFSHGMKVMTHVMTIKWGFFGPMFRHLKTWPMAQQITRLRSRPARSLLVHPFRSIVGITTNARRPRQTRKKSSRNQPQPGFVKRRSAPWVIIWGIFLEYQQWTVSVKLGLDYQRSWVFANKHQILWIPNRT